MSMTSPSISLYQSFSHGGTRLESDPSVFLSLLLFISYSWLSAFLSHPSSSSLISPLFEPRRGQQHRLIASGMNTQRIIVWANASIYEIFVITSYRKWKTYRSDLCLFLHSRSVPLNESVYYFNPCKPFNLPSDADPHSVQGEQCHNVLGCKQIHSGLGPPEYYTNAIRFNSTVLPRSATLTIRYTGSK